MKTKVAVFDLDGTVLDGESPFILTRSLMKNRMMSPKTILLMCWWGVRYRLRLPQTESTPRELMFSTMTGPSVEEIDEEILALYKRKIEKRIRAKAREEIERVRALGQVPILASASFKPITTAVVSELGFEDQVCTVMEERDGHYTGRVVGIPVEGDEKFRRVTALCDERFGAGNWEIANAYSDHYSDIPLLLAATRAVAIDPDGKLEREAKKHGWEIADWD